MEFSGISVVLQVVLQVVSSGIIPVEISGKIWRYYH